MNRLIIGRLRRLPAGMIGALLLIIVTEVFIDTHRIEMMGGSLWTYEITRRIATENVKDCDLLVLGDSLVSHGVSVNVIKERVGLNGYNLSISGSQAPASFIFLRDALAAGARPKFVLVDYSPSLLSADPWFNITNTPVIASYQDCVDLACRDRDPNLLASLLLRKTFPSVKYRESIRPVVLEALSGAGGTIRNLNLVLSRNREINRGFGIAADRRQVDLTPDMYISLLFKSFHCTPLNRLYIERLMNLAAEHQIKVVLVLPPYMQGLQAKLEEVGFDAKHQEFIRSLARQFPELFVFDASRAKFDPDVFIDSAHLGVEGATTFSVELAEYLQGLQNGLPEPDQRWCVLKRYRKQTTTARHETFDESQRNLSKITR